MMLLWAGVYIVKHYMLRIQILISAVISIFFQQVLELRKQMFTKAQESEHSKLVMKMTTVENSGQFKQKEPLIHY